MINSHRMININITSETDPQL